MVPNIWIAKGVLPPLDTQGALSPMNCQRWIRLMYGPRWEMVIPTLDAQRCVNTFEFRRCIPTFGGQRYIFIFGWPKGRFHLWMAKVSPLRQIAKGTFLLLRGQRCVTPFGSQKLHSQYQTFLHLDPKTSTILEESKPYWGMMLTLFCLASSKLDMFYTMNGTIINPGGDLSRGYL